MKQQYYYLAVIDTGCSLPVGEKLNGIPVLLCKAENVITGLHQPVVCLAQTLKQQRGLHLLAVLPSRWGSCNQENMLCSGLLARL